MMFRFSSAVMLVLVLAAAATAAAPKTMQVGDERLTLAGHGSSELISVDTLVGTWAGRWQTSDGATGSLGVVLSRVPGRDTVIGQFTFVVGAVSQTMRYEGQLENGMVQFPLVDRGRIVLEAATDAERALTARRLSGTWVESRGAFPAPRGTMELERAS